MAVTANQVQGQLQLILASLSVYFVYTYGSPVHDQRDSSVKKTCPKGWYHYDLFCVTHGQGSSEREVAEYCDSYGGIGIKGLCIIRANTRDTSAAQMDHKGALSLSLDFSLQGGKTYGGSPGTKVGYTSAVEDSGGDGAQPPSYTGAAADESENDDALLDQLAEVGNPLPGRLCPSGWTHYRQLCVYKPLSILERCHLMESVEFHGLCLKHANVVDGSAQDESNIYTEDKRICCCNSVKARNNNYGC